MLHLYSCSHYSFTLPDSISFFYPASERKPSGGRHLLSLLKLSFPLHSSHFFHNHRGDNNYWSWCDSTMFKAKQLRLKGPQFNDLFKSLTRIPRQSYVKLKNLVESLRPRSWQDKLSDDQAAAYVFIAEPDDWNRICDCVAGDVREIPVLCVSATFEEGASWPHFLTISTYTGRTDRERGV